MDEYMCVHTPQHTHMYAHTYVHTGTHTHFYSLPPYITYQNPNKFQIKSETQY